MSDDPAGDVRRYLEGDRDAAARLVRRAGRVAMPLAAAALGSRERASDLVQDVIVDVLRGLPRLKDPGAFEAWTRQIASRHVVRDLRGRRLRRGREEVLDEGLFAEASGDGDHDGLLMRLSVAGALRSLPPRQRVALALRYLHDQSDAEIAAALGCRPGTAASLLSRGRDALRADPGLRAIVGADHEGVAP